MANKKISIRFLQDEVLQDYKKVSMLVSAANCDFKCCKELGNNICQNSELVRYPLKQFTYKWLFDRYERNHLSQAIIFGGLEPFLQASEILDFIEYMRNERNCDDDIVIYTGYNKEEVSIYINHLKKYKNIIVKFGRFIPDSESIFDSVLGITLASKNQYAEKIS